MSSITITCPECGAEFDAAEQLDKHFQEFKLKEQELEQQKSEILNSKKINSQSTWNTRVDAEAKKLWSIN